MLEPFRKFSVFSGRACRSELWSFLVIIYAASVVTAAIDVLPGPYRPAAVNGELSIMLTFIVFIPMTAVTVRRLHDIDRSGRWVLLPLALAAMLLVCLAGVFASTFLSAGAATIFGNDSAFYAAGVALSLFGLSVVNILFLVWMLTPGTVGPNRFGPDPLADGAPPGA